MIYSKITYIVEQIVCDLVMLFLSNETLLDEIKLYIIEYQHAKIRHLIADANKLKVVIFLWISKISSSLVSEN